MGVSFHRKKLFSNFDGWNCCFRDFSKSFPEMPWNFNFQICLKINNEYKELKLFFSFSFFGFSRVNCNKWTLKSLLLKYIVPWLKESENEQKNLCFPNVEIHFLSKIRSSLFSTSFLNQKLPTCTQVFYWKTIGFVPSIWNLMERYGKKAAIKIKKFGFPKS